MLVLARKCGEAIVIPEMNVVITILENKGDRIRIGIDAPSNVLIHRREVWERIRSQQDQEPKADSLSQFSADDSAVCL